MSSTQVGSSAGSSGESASGESPGVQGGSNHEQHPDHLFSWIFRAAPSVSSTLVGSSAG